MNEVMSVVIIALAIISLLMPFLLSTHEDEGSVSGTTNTNSEWCEAEGTLTVQCVLLIGVDGSIKIPSHLKEGMALES